MRLLDFQNFDNVQCCSIFLIFVNLWGSELCVIGFFCSSRAPRVQNASFVRYLYLGRNSAHRQRMVKYISKFHFSHKENLEPPMNCQPTHWRKDPYSNLINSYHEKIPKTKQCPQEQKCVFLLNLETTHIHSPGVIN